MFRSRFGAAVSSIISLRASFSTSAVAASRRAQLRKPNYSSLTKHLKPDGLNGRERRDLLRAKLKSSSGSKRNVYVPVKHRLEPIPSVQSLAAEASGIKTFDDLGLSPSVVAAVHQGHLKHIENPRPTEIQALTIPRLLKHTSVLCAAETGSGKTLAYLLPIIDRLKREEEDGRVQRKSGRPRAVVLVPTRELVVQVCATCKSLAHVAKFRALAVDGRTARSQYARAMQDPVDVLVTTPTTLVQLMTKAGLAVGDVRHLVIDEADSLFDAGWGDDITRILDVMQGKKGGVHVTVVSATLPKSVHSALKIRFGDEMLKITTPSLHRALPNLKQSFIDLERFNGNRQLALLEVLKKNKKDQKTLVFCNTKKSAELLQKWLTTKDLPVLALSKDVDRKRVLDLFSGRVVDEADGTNHDILISTDIASRGLDTTFVDHVVLYDFPDNAIDYLHRVGRTARAGRTGKATSLIGRKQQMLADRIRRAIREGTVLT